ncbi:MAG: peptidoglycan DD-metalloendopeptidase family protein [Rhizobiaceae bacterium]|nr:peptidoglycan DD-metalloendopeptidase family protein [Rhizobiaceae bacterium]
MLVKDQIMRSPKHRFQFSFMLGIIAFLGMVLGSANSNAQEVLIERHEKTTQILEQIRQDISVSSNQEAQLAAEISALQIDGAALNERLISATANSRALEQKMQQTGERILALEETRDNLRRSLKNRKSLLSEVLAALQRMGRNPPPALLVTPQDALKSVRSAILLGSVVPEIRSETEILVVELSQLEKLSKEITVQRLQLTQDLETEATEERRLALLIVEKKKRSKQARETLAVQGVEAAKLAAEAANLKNLIQQLETEIESVNLAAESARKADLDRKKKQNEQIASFREEVSRPDFSDTSRINPAVTFNEAKGFLIKPVNGVEIRQYGDKDEVGDPSPSIAIATRVNARVISPADGWVVYSGPFRSYGQMLILNVGSNYHIIMSGMEKVDVEMGQFVLVGEPVGIMGARRIASAGTIDIGLSRPVLAIEFREDQEPIDPAPWWQVNTDKRSNNDS